MSKAKEKAASGTRPNPSSDPSLDYQQLAEHMLGSWQDQWRQFASQKDNPFTSAYGDWMNTWSSAMSGWTGANADTKTEEPTPHAAASQPKEPAGQPSKTTATTAPTGHAGGASPVSPAAATPSNARDVLLTELARRVEFLHERVVSLETELDRLKCNK